MTALGPAAVLSVEERDAILAAISRRTPTGQRNRALVATLRYSGVRIGSALAARPGDAELDRGVLRVRTSLKGGVAHTVPLHPHAVAELQAWEHWRAMFAPGARWLFCTISQPNPGKALQRRYVCRMLARAAGRAGISGRVHPHAFRASLAVELHDRGVPVGEIRDILGHSSVAVTDSYLRRLGTEGRKQAILDLP